MQSHTPDWRPRRRIADNRIRESAGLTQAQVGERMPTQITKQRVGAIEAADDLQHSTVVAYLAAVGHEIQIINSHPGDGVKI